MGDSHIDLYIGFKESMHSDIYNIIVRIDELTLREDVEDEMIPDLSWDFVAPDIFHIERDYEATEICPLNKELIIP